MLVARVIILLYIIDRCIIFYSMKFDLGGVHGKVAFMHLSFPQADSRKLVVAQREHSVEDLRICV